MSEDDRKGIAAGAARKRQRETASDRARIGTVIAGSYRIDEVIGRGAIGAVFGGIHLRLERPVAIKFVDPSLVDEPEIRARFKREAKIAAQIDSSHSVEIFDYGLADDGAPFIVMERLVGEDVHHRLQRERKLPVDRALRIAKQVCRALGAAHGHGIVHRDLKPENVYLVRRDGEAEFVKVVDFGLSTFVQTDDTRLTRAGQSVGTPLYMAPEQAGATAFDVRVDVYSLGVLIFEMTTGRLPFEATTLQQLLVALATGTPKSIRDYDRTLPGELDALIKRFIARDPKSRPSSAAAALAEIVALEEHLLELYGVTKEGSKSGGVALDGLPGKLPSNFAQEVESHLTEMRRTGSLSTASLEAEAAAAVRETKAQADRESGHLPSPPGSARRRHSPSDPDSRSSPPVNSPSSGRSPNARRPKADIIEEDSGVFVGRVGSGPQKLPTSGKNDPSRVRVSAKPPAEKPSRSKSQQAPESWLSSLPRLLLLAAFFVFVGMVTLVVVRVLRR